MPRHVDHQQRRAEIIDAALQVIATDGLGGLSFRAVASRLGGSVTLVTHYYESIQALLDHLAEDLIDSWEQELRVVEGGESDPRRRLQLLLEWALPLHEKSLNEERAWANLLAQRDRLPSGMVDAFDGRMRRFIADHLIDLVDVDAIEHWTDYLRALTSGITAMTLLSPGAWTPERQIAVLDQGLEMLDRAIPARPERGSARSRA